MNVGEFVDILNKLPRDKEVTVIFEACDYPVFENEIIEKKYSVFINADQSPIDWSKVE